MDIGHFYEERPVTTALIGVTGEERGRIVSATTAFGDLLACAPDELAGVALFDFIHPEDRLRSLHEFCRLVQRRSASFDGVGRLCARDGTVRWMAVHANLVPCGEGDRIAIRVFALPVRFLPVEDVPSRRTRRSNRLHLALDLETAATMAPAQRASEPAAFRRLAKQPHAKKRPRAGRPERVIQR
jgi:PAS domain S-box-containing protein